MKKVLYLFLIVFSFQPNHVYADNLNLQIINDYRDWGWDVLVISNDYITLAIVPAIGGRILQYDLGTDTAMAVNESLFGETFYSGSPTPYDGTWGYGGFKTWPAPQTSWNWPPPPKLAWGNYDYDVLHNSADSVVIYLQGETETIRTVGLRFDRYVTVYANSSRVKIVTVLFNDAVSEQEWSIWDVTQNIVQHEHTADYSNFSVYFPIANDDDIWYTQNIPNRSQIIPGVERVTYSPVEGKISAYASDGWAAFVDERDKQAYLKLFSIDEGADYPESGRNMQVYTSGSYHYLELEINSPLFTLQSGDSCIFIEDWYATRSKGPIYRASPAGVVTRPASYDQTRQSVTGSYGVFNECSLSIRFLDQDLNVLPSGLQFPFVSPLDIMNIGSIVSPLPEDIFYIRVSAYGDNDSLIGVLDQVEYRIGDELIAYEAPSMPVIDGVADDSCWSNALWYPINRVWIPYDASVSESDFKGRFKISWTPNRLLFLVEITDDVLSDMHSDPLVNYWDDDCVEIFLDEDHSGGLHENNFNAFAYHVSRFFDVVDMSPTGVRLFNDHIDADYVKQGNTYTWELSVKVYDDTYVDDATSAPVSLIKDKIMGLSLAYCDNDGSATRDNFFGSKYQTEENSNRSYIDASLFGRLQLLETAGAIVPTDITAPEKTGNEPLPEILTFYPNPASGVIFFKSSMNYQGAVIVTIRNLLGQVVRSQTFPEYIQNGMISLEGFGSGMYVFEVKSKDYAFSKQVLIY